MCAELFSCLRKARTASFSGVQVCLSYLPVSLSPSIQQGTISLHPTCRLQAPAAAPRPDQPQGTLFIPQPLAHPARDPDIESLFPETRRDLRRAHLIQVLESAKGGSTILLLRGSWSSERGHEVHFRSKGRRKVWNAGLLSQSIFVYRSFCCVP